MRMKFFPKDSEEYQMTAEFCSLMFEFWDVHADQDDAWWAEMTKKVDAFIAKYSNTDGFSRDIGLAVINRAGRINYERLKIQREGAKDAESS